ncbi:MAG: hypothetical protein HYZ57_13615, partial [Acidobacteria bacterium]|nr:hypothetical protein [Acidobacteriota bacterium]
MVASFTQTMAMTRAAQRATGTIITAALLAFPCAAQLTVRVVGTTPTQAVLVYDAPDELPCTIVVSESPSLSPPIHDVNPDLFPNSNQDLSRASTLVDRFKRTVTIGARTSELAADGKLYSR